MKKCKDINIRIHNNTDNNHISNIINKFHVEFIEHYLEELSLPNQDKIEVIDRVIKLLKSSDFVN